MNYKSVYNRLPPTIKQKYSEDWGNRHSFLSSTLNEMLEFHQNYDPENTLISLVNHINWANCLHRDLWVQMSRHPEKYLKNKIIYEDTDA